MPDVAAKVRPIALTAAEVLAIQSGRKTVLRRPVSASNSTVYGYSSRQLWGHLLWDSEVPAPAFVDSGFPNSDGVYRYAYLHVPARHPEDRKGWERQYRVQCRWEPGDRLWCRERWAISALHDGPRAVYAADGNWAGRAIAHLWNPASRMPKRWSRITLEVESVGVAGRWEWAVEVRRIDP